MDALNMMTTDMRLESVRQRVGRLVSKCVLSPQEAVRFLRVEEQLYTKSTDANWLSSFHDTDEYRRLLEKVLRGLQYIGEYGASERLSIYMGELGTISPGVFLTPWELSLCHIDEMYERGQASGPLTIDMLEDTAKGILGTPISLSEARVIAKHILESAEKARLPSLEEKLQGEDNGTLSHIGEAGAGREEDPTGNS